MSHKQLLNLKTGEFTLDDSIESYFVVSDKTTPEDLIKHFGEDRLRITDYKNGHSNYNIYDLKIGDLYFILTFYFKEIIKETVKIKQLTRISFVLSETSYTNSGDSWDNFDEKKEKKKGQFIQNWLMLQRRGSTTNSDWGDIDVYYDFHNISYDCIISYRDVISGEKLKNHIKNH